MSDQTRKVVNIILALAVSIAAWIFVVYNYYPMTTERYSDVPVKYTGLQTLANRGYAVMEQNTSTVDVVLLQRRADTGHISADNISVTADVSNLETGENTVALNVKGPEGTTVSDTSVRTVTMNIESAYSADMDISVEYTPDAEEDAVPVVEELSVDTATVIAAESKLNEIDRVAAVIEPEELSTRARPMSVELAALDSDGNKVLNVVIQPETVSFRAYAGYTKTVSLNVPVKDNKDDSYERTYTVPNTLVIKGGATALSSVSSITAEEINIGNYYEDAELPIELILPDGIYRAEDDSELVLKLKVTEKADTDSGS